MADSTAVGLKWHLGGFKYNLASEDSIQRGIESALHMGGFGFEREALLSMADRVDFLVGGVAIEVKRHGAVADLLRQLARYARHETVSELLVVTARIQASALPSVLQGKPLECLVLTRSIF